VTKTKTVSDKHKNRELETQKTWIRNTETVG